MSGRWNVVLIVFAVLASLLSSALFTVTESQTTLVLEFGKPVRIIKTPGLHAKMPFIQNVLTFDERLLAYNAEPESYLTVEKKQVVVDSFAQWRIADPLKYYTRVRNETNASARLADFIRSGLRGEFGKRSLEDLISGDRKAMTRSLVKSVDRRAAELGLQVVDIRLVRVDLPKEVSTNVFRRMEAERSREAKSYRSRGAEMAEQIRADADRQKTVLLAEAYRKAQTLRGEGDAQASRTYAQSFGQDPKFFSLYRSLQAYRQSIGTKDVMVLDPNAEYLRYFRGAGQ